MSIILSVKNLTKTYKDFTAVNDVSFEVREGEVVGLLGPNGAGKTTTIHMILGLLTPSSGSIQIFGQNLRDNREEVLARMNFAAPYAALPYNLTVYQNLAVFALLYGIRDYKEKITILLKEFGLAQFRGHKTGALSSGEQTRLVLAKAFLNDPKFLLFDEPTASLDPAIARELRATIYKKTEELQGAILWTSHNMREMETMCDRILFLSHGKIVASGTPEELRSKFGKQDLEEVFISLVEKSEKAYH